MTGSADKTAKVWDAQGGKQLEVRMPGPVQRVEFDPHSGRIATVADDCVRIWTPHGQYLLQHSYGVPIVACMLGGVRDPWDEVEKPHEAPPNSR